MNKRLMVTGLAMALVVIFLPTNVFAQIHAGGASRDNNFFGLQQFITLLEEGGATAEFVLTALLALSCLLGIARLIMGLGHRWLINTVMGAIILVCMNSFITYVKSILIDNLP